MFFFHSWRAVPVICLLRVRFFWISLLISSRKCLTASSSDVPFNNSSSTSFNNGWTVSSVKISRSSSLLLMSSKASYSFTPSSTIKANSVSRQVSFSLFLDSMTVFSFSQTFLECKATDFACCVNDSIFNFVALVASLFSN